MGSTEPVDLREAESWVRAHVAAAGRLEHVQSEPWASVYRARSGDDVVWFKVCAPRQAFEVTLTAALSERWPIVTEVLGHDVDRRWLLMADAGEDLASAGNPPELWLEVLPAYAELQIGEAAYGDEHVANGVPDFRLGWLPALFEEFLRVDLPIDPDELALLAACGPRVIELCEEIDTAGIASPVQHDDLHMTNVYVKRGALRVLDWGDASIAHPFFSLYELFRFLRERNELPRDDPWFGRLRDAYLEPWGSGRQETFDLALQLGAVAHAISWLHQRDALPTAQDRAAFDEWFPHIVRLALRSMT